MIAVQRGGIMSENNVACAVAVVGVARVVLSRATASNKERAAPVRQ